MCAVAVVIWIQPRCREEAPANEARKRGSEKNSMAIDAAQAGGRNAPLAIHCTCPLGARFGFFSGRDGR